MAYQDADLLVGILARDAMGGELHQDRLSRHWYKCVSIESSKSMRRQHTERKLLVNTRADDIRVDDQAVGHVVQGEKDGVGQEELKAVSKVIAGSEGQRPTISGISMRRLAPVPVRRRHQFWRRPETGPEKGDKV